MEKLQRWKHISQWTPEDRLLHAYWQAVGGIIYTEVVVGGRGKSRQLPVGSKPRRIDGVRICLADTPHVISDIVTYSRNNRDEFEHIIQDAFAEVVEVKNQLGRNVIGQAIIGIDLLELAFEPRETHAVIVCKVGDPLLELICRRRDIQIWKSVSSTESYM